MLYIPQMSPIMWPILIVMSTLLLMSTMSSMMKMSNNEKPMESKVMKTKKSWKW